MDKYCVWLLYMSSLDHLVFRLTALCTTSAHTLSVCVFVCDWNNYCILLTLKYKHVQRTVGNYGNRLTGQPISQLTGWPEGLLRSCTTNIYNAYLGRWVIRRTSVRCPVPCSPGLRSWPAEPSACSCTADTRSLCSTQTKMSLSRITLELHY